MTQNARRGVIVLNARRKLLALLLAFGAMLLAVPGPASATASGSGNTIVTFTFDDSWADQAPALDDLASHGMTATLFTISQRIDNKTALTLPQLRHYALLGFEIGGHTLTHPYLTHISRAQQRHEICSDRATLASWGFKVTSFAYPHGDEEEITRHIVQQCGYNSARTLPGLRSPGYGPNVCLADCPPAESIPPARLYAIRTPTTVRTATTVATLQEDVTQAEHAGGGWVPLVFHHICDGCSDNAFSLKNFKQFTSWLSTQSQVVVKTQDQVIGGAVQPVVGKPVPAPDVPLAEVNGSAASTSTTTATQPSSRTTSSAGFTLAGVPIGQTQIIFFGLIIAVIVIVTFRLASRGARHGSP